MHESRRNHGSIEGFRARQLDMYRGETIRQVNEQTGKVRQRYITTIPGQEMVYLPKEAEARSYVQDRKPNPLNYPLLTAEVGVTGDSHWEVAQIVLNKAMRWRTVNAQLEQLRLSTTKQINEAVSQEALNQILEQFESELAQFNES